MIKRVIRQRKRIFFAVEGEGEQSFVKFMQHHADKQGLHVHLDCEILSGGGYKTMLEKAIHYRSRKGRLAVKASILLVDSDREEREDDGWSLDQFKKIAAESGFTPCLQNPNQEGLLLRLHPDKHTHKPDAANAHRQLRKVWPDYKKPADAQTLISKFSLEDLLRVTRVDEELKTILIVIGLVKKQ